MPEAPRMRGLTPSELIAWTPPYIRSIISQKILVDQGTMCIYGAEGTWKSMLSMDLAFRIASGRDWFGYTVMPSPVYLFQSEIPQAEVRDRIIKYMQGNILATDNVHFCTELYEKVDKGWGYTELEKEIIRTRPRVVIIDPVYNSFSAKLADDYESGLAIDRLNMLRGTYKVSFILIAHDRKAEHVEGATYHYGTDELFGSGRWKKWLDTIVYVELKNDGDPMVDLKLSFEKTRHSEHKVKEVSVEINRDNLTFKRKELPNA